MSKVPVDNLTFTEDMNDKFTVLDENDNPTCTGDDMVMVGRLCGPQDEPEYLDALEDMQAHLESIIQSYNPFTKTYVNVTVPIQDEDLFGRVIHNKYFSERLGFIKMHGNDTTKAEIFLKNGYNVTATTMNIIKFKVKSILKDTDYATMALSASFIIVLIILLVGA